VLRIPFCNEALIPGKMPTGINYYTNADLTGLTSLEVLDQVIAYCDDLGLKVFLDRHSAKAGGLTSEDLWYIPGDTYYTEQRWITDWMMLARRYAGNPTVVGADLFNEPKRTATWTAWREAAQRCGNAIHLVNPDWLIIVEGTGEEDEYGENAWWGGNLKGVATDPVVLTVPNKLVYSAHDYPSTVYNQEWFSHPNYPLNLPDHWRPFWGYLFEQNIAPIIIGEFGTHLRSTSDRQWLDKITDYMDGDFDLDGSVDLEPGRKGISWTFWCLNPNSGDTGGILQSDWMTPELEKLAYLRASMEGAPTAIPSAAPSTATPSAQPSTAQPSEIPSNLPSSMPSIYTCPGPFEVRCVYKGVYRVCIGCV
jgi:aryl-phospho-beta-D-glucosidase BglC (GH1 family)